MNKLLLAVLLGFIYVVLSGTNVSAATPEACFAFNSSTGTITNYYNYESNNTANPACLRDVEIPSSIGGVTVTAIGAASNYWNVGSATSFAQKSLTSVSIPDSVTSIGNSAFYYNQIETITMGDLITSIGNQAFAFNNIETVDLPSLITTISPSLFYKNSLTSVTVPDGVTSIGQSAFWGNRLTHITIPEGVSIIGRHAIEFNYLTEVTIPSSMDQIGEQAFLGNKLKAVTIPDGVTSIGYNAFAEQNQYGRDLEIANSSDAPSLYSYDPDEVQRAYDEIWYVRLYTENPLNPNGLTDGVLSESDWMYADSNSNNEDDSLGGHIVNPASVSIVYEDVLGDKISTSLMLSGILSSGAYIQSYYSSHGPYLFDTYNPTPEQEEKISQAMASYYRIGDEVTITPPVIPGYITPPTQTFVLGAADNTYSYVYASEADASETPGDATETGELAETGMNVSTVVSIASTLIIIGILSGKTFLRTKQRIVL